MLNHLKALSIAFYTQTHSAVNIIKNSRLLYPLIFILLKCCLCCIPIPVNLMHFNKILQLCQNKLRQNIKIGHKIRTFVLEKSIRKYVSKPCGYK